MKSHFKQQLPNGERLCLLRMEYPIKHFPLPLFCAMLFSLPLAASAQAPPVSLPQADAQTVAAFAKLNARLHTACALTYVSNLTVQQPMIDPKKQHFSITAQGNSQVQTANSSGIAGVTQNHFTIHGFLEKPNKARFEVYQGARMVRLLETDGKTYCDFAPATGHYRSGKDQGDPFGPKTPAASVILTAFMFMSEDIQGYYFPSPLTYMPLTASRSRLGGKSAWEIVCGGAALPPEKKDLGDGFAAQLFLDAQTALPLQLERDLYDIPQTPVSSSSARQGKLGPLISLIRDTYVHFDLKAEPLPSKLFAWKPTRGMKFDANLDQK